MALFAGGLARDQPGEVAAGVDLELEKISRRCESIA
jgi:hypothetical protein